MALLCNNPTNIPVHYLNGICYLQDVESASVKSSLSADGVLTIAAPKKAIAAPEERQIAIQMTDSGDAKQ